MKLLAAELVPGALLDCTGRTTRVDLIGQLSRAYKTHIFSYLDNTPPIIIIITLAIRQCVVLF